MTAETDPKLIAAETLATTLIAEHGLDGWTFKFNRSLSSCVGKTKDEQRRIELNPHCLNESADDEIRDTILHEIAHALLFMRCMEDAEGDEELAVRRYYKTMKAHGPEWQALAVSVGARPMEN